LLSVALEIVTGRWRARARANPERQAPAEACRSFVRSCRIQLRSPLSQLGETRHVVSGLIEMRRDSHLAATTLSHDNATAISSGSAALNRLRARTRRRRETSARTPSARTRKQASGAIGGVIGSSVVRAAALCVLLQVAQAHLAGQL
jgi:hypothetical protein